MAYGSGRVLLVEDEEMVREIAKEILEEIGYTVLVADTPRAALSLCENQETRIDLLLTDVVMPGMSGVELKKKIEVIRPGIKVLFMSGYTSNVIAKRGILEKGVHFIQKPFRMKPCPEGSRSDGREVIRRLPPMADRAPTSLSA